MTAAEQGRAAKALAEQTKQRIANARHAGQAAEAARRLRERLVQQ